MCSLFRNFKVLILDLMWVIVSLFDFVVIMVFIGFIGFIGFIDIVIEFIFECYCCYVLLVVDKCIFVDKYLIVYECVI